MKTEITIETILEKVDKRGKQFHVLRDNGEGYFVWDSKLLEGIAEGDVVEIEHTKGEFPKVKAVKKIGSAPKQKTLKTSWRSDSPKVKALNCAVALMGNMTIPTDDPAAEREMASETIVMIAKVFEKYLTGEDSGNK